MRTIASIIWTRKPQRWRESCVHLWACAENQLRNAALILVLNCSRQELTSACPRRAYLEAKLTSKNDSCNIEGIIQHLFKKKACTTLQRCMNKSRLRVLTMSLGWLQRPFPSDNWPEERDFSLTTMAWKTYRGAPERSAAVMCLPFDVRQRNDHAWPRMNRWNRYTVANTDQGPLFLNRLRTQERLLVSSAHSRSCRHLLPRITITGRAGEWSPRGSAFVVEISGYVQCTFVRLEVFLSTTRTV